MCMWHIHVLAHLRSEQPITLESCKSERNIRLKKMKGLEKKKIRLTALIMSDKDTQTHTHTTHTRTERHMHSRERPCVYTDTRLHVAQSSQRDGCNSPRLGRADAESPRNTEEDEEMLLEGEYKPVGETKELDTKAVVLRANKRAIHDRYVVTRTAKDTMTGK